MDIDSMRALFGQEADYYNTVYSDKALDIEEGRLYSVTTKEDIVRGSSVFVKLMFPLVSILTAAGTVISEILVQPANTPSPISVRPVGRFIC